MPMKNDNIYAFSELPFIKGFIGKVVSFISDNNDFLWILLAANNLQALQ